MQIAPDTVTIFEYRKSFTLTAVLGQQQRHRRLRRKAFGQFDRLRREGRLTGGSYESKSS